MNTLADVNADYVSKMSVLSGCLCPNWGTSNNSNNSIDEPFRCNRS